MKGPIRSFGCRPPSSPDLRLKYLAYADFAHMIRLRMSIAKWVGPRLTIFLAVVVSLACGTSPDRKEQTRPNFLFILVDDLGWSDLGCYGSNFYETPRIDRFASQGMRFTNAYAACPVCSPTRASIMTGRYPARLKITDWIPGRQASRGPDPSERLLGPEFPSRLPLTETTLAEAMKEGGYRTFFAGKWHLGGKGFYPENQGFETNIAGAEFGWPRGGYFSPYDNPKITDGPSGEYLTDRLTTETIRFIESDRNSKFFAYLSFYTVHNPLQAKKAWIEHFEEKRAALEPPSGPRFLPEGWKQARQFQDHPVYAAMVRSLDENVGRLLDALDRLDLTSRTVVFFMSDNGGLSTAEGSPTSNLPLRGGKGWLYEGGIREPLIVRYPESVQPGTLCEVPVMSTDFYPTILQLAGLRLRPQQHVDGVSFFPLLTRSATSTAEDRPLFWHYPHYSNQGGAPGGAVRFGRYKLIEFFEDDRCELYDLAADVGEQHDLSAEMADRKAALTRRLHDWRESVDADMPTPNPDYDPDAPRPKN